VVSRTHRIRERACLYVDTPLQDGQQRTLAAGERALTYAFSRRVVCRHARSRQQGSA